jgi:hypothetical protein
VTPEVDGHRQVALYDGKRPRSHRAFDAYRPTRIQDTTCVPRCQGAACDDSLQEAAHVPAEVTITHDSASSPITLRVRILVNRIPLKRKRKIEVLAGPAPHSVNEATSSPGAGGGFALYVPCRL